MWYLSIICVKFITKLQLKKHHHVVYWEVLLVDSAGLRPSCVRLKLNSKWATCTAVMATTSDSAAGVPAGCKDNQPTLAI